MQYMVDGGEVCSDHIQPIILLVFYKVVWFGSDNNRALGLAHGELSDTFWVASRLAPLFWALSWRLQMNLHNPGDLEMSLEGYLRAALGLSYPWTSQEIDGRRKKGEETPLPIAELWGLIFVPAVSTSWGTTSTKEEASDIDDPLLSLSSIDFKISFNFVNFIECMVKKVSGT